MTRRWGIPLVLFVISACTSSRSPAAHTTVEPVWAVDIGAATTAPSVQGSVVIVGSAKGGVFSFPTSCTDPCSPIWRASTEPLLITQDTDYTGTADAFFGATGANGMVYVAGKRTLYAFAAECSERCKPAWTAPVLNATSPPVAAGAEILIATAGEGGRLMAFGASCSGRCAPRWSVSAGHGEWVHAPLVEGDIVIATVGTPGFDPPGTSGDDGIRAIDAGTGSPIWIGGDAGRWCCVATQPVAEGAHVFDTGSEGAYAFDLDCTPQASSCSPSWVGAITDGFIGSPTAVGDTVFVGTETSGGSGEGRLYAFPTSCSAICKPRWSAQVPSELVVGWIQVADDAVIATSREQGDITAFPLDCSTPCAPLWRTEVLSTNAGTVDDTTTTGPLSPVFANGRMYVATSGGKLLGFNLPSCPSDGTICHPEWTWNSPSGPLTDPVIADNMLFVGSQQGTLYAFAREA